MAQPGTLPVTAQIDTTSAADTYATHFANRGKGGYVSVANATARDAITPERRFEGMKVRTNNDGQEFVLASDLTTWNTFTPTGGAAGGDLSGTYPNPLIANIVASGTKGTASRSAAVTINTKGQVTALTDNAIQITESQVTALTGKYIPQTDKAIALGVATLDAGGHVPLAQLNLSAFNYKNSWNASTNTPTLANGTGAAGDAYIAGVAGTTNFGAGGITFAIGDLVIYNGSIWQKVSGVGAGVSSWNGLAGAITATTANVPVSTNKNYVTDLQVSALAGSPHPATGANWYATKGDLIAPISVTKEWCTPENFGDGLNLTGDGTLRKLNTLVNPATGVNYVDGDLAAAFPNVTGASVANWTYDDACIDQAMRTMELNLGNHCLTFHDNKYYVLNVGHQLPAVSATVSTNRAFSMILDGHGSVFRNGSGTPLIMFDRMPADQNNAVSVPNNYVSYQFHFSQMQFLGGSFSRGSGDVAIRIGAIYPSTFDKIKCYNFDTAVKNYFNLGGYYTSCRFADSTTEGVYLNSGNWSGATVPNSGSNGTSFTSTVFRCAPGCYSGLTAIGSDGITISGGQSVFEGSNGGTNPEHHIVYDNSGSTVNKLVKFENIHIEQPVLKSNILIKASAQTVMADISNIFTQYGAGRALVETDSTGGGSITAIISKVPDNSADWRMRAVGNGYNWFAFDFCKLAADQVVLDKPGNWDVTTIGGQTGFIPNAGTFLSVLRVAH